MNSKKSAPSHTRVLLDSDDDDDQPQKVEWAINSDYAKKYDDWRAKEEMQKLKDKYGPDAEESSSSTSESEDEDAEALTPQTERDFFKTLSILKSNDPRIYDKSQKFFDESAPESESKSSSSSKSKPMFLKDYERKVLVEQGGLIVEGKDQIARPFQGTYDQEQADLKRKLTALAHDDSEDEELLVERPKSEAEIQKQEEDYAVWLRSKEGKEGLKDVTEKEALKPLRTFWTDSSLDDGEKFLRDYLLDKKYVDKDKDRLPSYGDIVEAEHFSEEEEELEKADEFEQKYNFRFEEPDPDFIKRFPRTMGDSLRRKDDTRKIKRDEIKERKDAEKERIREDIKQLKSLKRREILQKMEKLKAITGKEEMAFAENDIDGDFDPESHDAMMRKAFSEDYYQSEEMEKPEISDESDVDEYFEENASEEEREDVGNAAQTDHRGVEESQASTSKGTGKRKRKTKVSEAMLLAKPAFDPDNKKLEEYLDEYYKLDFEDVVAGMPCRFKYRSVVPNNFGLTAEEILTAPDRELNAWASLKKTVQHRSEEEELYDVRTFKQKASLKDIKLKIIPSLAEGSNSSLLGTMESEADDTAAAGQTGKKRRKRKAKRAQNAGSNGTSDEAVTSTADPTESSETAALDNTETKTTQPPVESVPDPSSTGEGKRKRRKKNKLGSSHAVSVSSPANSAAVVTAVPTSVGDSGGGRKKRRNRKANGNVAPNAEQSAEPSAKRQKLEFDHDKFVRSLPSTKISDERLKAYGLNPKKHRAKEKYVLLAKAKNADP